MRKNEVGFDTKINLVFFGTACESMDRIILYIFLL